MNWEVFCKRTGDPKLQYIEGMLDERGIPHRRNGESWHAPILEVPEQHLDVAWRMLSEKLPGRGRKLTLDEMPDNHPIFRGDYEPQ